MKNSYFVRRTAIAAFVSSLFINTAIADPIFDFTNTRPSSILDVTEQFAENNAFNLGSGSLTFRFKNEASSGYSTLLGVSDPTQDTRYIWFYARRTGNGEQFGIEIRDGQSNNLIPNAQLVTSELVRNADGYRTVTYTFDKEAQQIKIYVDGQLQKTANRSKFFEDIPGLSAAYVGKTLRYSMPSNPFAGNVYYSSGVAQVLSEDEVRAKHAELIADQAYAFSKYEKLGAFKSDKEAIFSPKQKDSENYRIPSLFTTQDGVVIAAIDKRNQHSSDWGDIDTAIRRSFDGGKTWEDDQLIIDLASNTPIGAATSALIIDPVITQDKNTGRIFMLLDMFPESQALFGMFSNSQASFESEGSGHIKVGDKYYRLLTAKNGHKFTLRDDGIVYNMNGEAQDYRVVIEGDPSIAFKDLGDIYEISTNTKVGNIFLKQDKDNINSPFKAHYTSYLWLTYSDDNGATWSSPKDITTQVKEDWMRFLGTGPGTGIQLKNGNLVLPVYYTNRDNKQSSALIISEDGGKTWIRGASPNDAYLNEIGGSRYLNINEHELTESQVVELDNGMVKMFSRNRSGQVIISTSHDGGMTWEKNEKFKDPVLLDPYSQMSVIKYSKRINGKEYLVFANPHASSRINGVAWLGEVQEDGAIDWKYSKAIKPGAYAYNSLTELPNGEIGLLYENGTTIQFVRFNLQELVWHDNLIYRDSRNNENLEVSLDSAKEETFWKIGDGEMIKVGIGKNQAHLIIEEGLATFAQTADVNGERQAYKSVKVNERGTLRMESASQIPLESISLNKGTFDLNGHHYVIESENKNTGLYAEEINGNFVNHKPDVTARLTYAMNGNRQINGVIGDLTHPTVLDFIYQPSEADSNLAFNGNSVINVIDVKSGNVAFAARTLHQISQAYVRSGASLTMQDDSIAVIDNVTLAQDANLVADIAENKTALLVTENVAGRGNVVKKGQGTLQFLGDFNHTGELAIQSGQLELLNNAKVVASLNLASGAALLGAGEILGKALWQAGSFIKPNVVPLLARSAFEMKTLTFNSVINEGASIALRVANTQDDMKTWSSDQLIINGDFQSNQAVPVHLEMLGTHTGKADSNNNGQYDADEGVSLIQVKGEGDVGAFVLGSATDWVNSVYNFVLVSVDKGVNGNNYYDYRLQNQLIDETGKPLETVIRNRTTQNSSVPETVTNNAEDVSNLPLTSTSSSPSLDAPISTQEQTVEIVENTPTNARESVKAQIPSYLVVNSALLSQSDKVVDMFNQNLQAKHKKGFYVLQQHSNTNYDSDLNFRNYGYDYKSSQNSTLFGGYVPMNNNTELHAALGFSHQKVKPKAVDGSSSARYKTTSLLLAMHNRWEQLQLNTKLGYHWHHGDISTALEKDIAKVKAKQLYVGTELGYSYRLKHFSVMPIVGLSYRQLDVNLKDNTTAQWNVNVEDSKVFSQYAGTYLGWENNHLAVKLGALYEHNQQNTPAVRVSEAANTVRFSTGRLDNAILLNASAEVSIWKSLKLGVTVDHRLSVSEAKRKQTDITGKLEYQF